MRNRTLLAVSFAVCAAYTGIGMVSPVFILYARSRGASLGIISAMASAYLISNFAAQYPSGLLADRWGRRPVIMAGLLVQAVVSLIYLLITDPLLFVALRVAEGLAAAAILPSARALIADAIPAEHRGAAYGLFGAFFNAGFLIGPALGGLLAATGYASAFLGAFGFRLLAMLIVITLIPRAVQRTVSERTQAQDTHRLRTIFKLPLLGAYVLAFGDYLFLGFDLTLLPIWMHDHLGASAAVIGVAYMTWAVPSILLSPIGGRVADRAWRSILIYVFGLGQVPLYIMYGLASSAWVIVGLFAVHAVLYSFIQPAVDAHVAAASNENARASIQGMYSTIGLIGAFAGASGFTSLYALDFRLPLYVQGGVYCLCVLIGGTLIYLAEARGLVARPSPRRTPSASLPGEVPTR